jgi:hypothetical protein
MTSVRERFACELSFVYKGSSYSIIRSTDSDDQDPRMFAVETMVLDKEYLGAEWIQSMRPQDPDLEKVIIYLIEKITPFLSEFSPQTRLIASFVTESHKIALEQLQNQARMSYANLEAAIGMDVHKGADLYGTMKWVERRKREILEETAQRVKLEVAGFAAGLENVKNLNPNPDE